MVGEKWYTKNKVNLKANFSMVLEKVLEECFFLMENITLVYGKMMNFLVKVSIVIIILVYIKVFFLMVRKMDREQSFILIIVIIKALLKII